MNVGVNYHVPWLGYTGGWGDVNIGVNYHVAWRGYGGGLGDVNVRGNHVAWLKVWQPSQKPAMFIKAFGSGLAAGYTETTMAKTFWTAVPHVLKHTEKAELKRARVFTSGATLFMYTHTKVTGIWHKL